jgi:hypothetical protein
MPTTPQEELETRRIILLRGKNPNVLVGFDGTRCTLPQVQIPRWQRVAENLTAALSETCGIEAVSLSSLEALLLETCSDQVFYEIMEPCVPDGKAPRDKRWIRSDSLAQSAFRDPSDFQAVRQAIAQCMAYAKNTTRGPFGKSGWFHELKQWVQEEIGKHGLHLSGGFRQLNASPTFSLIRFETDGPAVWFKAVGVPNQREYPVTLALARHFSRFVPQIIVARPECNGWLAREAEGPLLDECFDLALWEAAATDLAELQIDSLGRSLHLLDAGARDLRPLALAELVEPFFGAMAELMERQIKMPPAALTGNELRHLSTRVQDALALLDDSRIPNAVGHLDINPGNIVCSPTGCVFLDWAEAFVGHPFFTFQYLLEHLRQLRPADRSRESRLIAAYTERWQRLVSPAEVAEALAIAPLLALFAYTVSVDGWRTSTERCDPERSDSLRSLTRRMKREGDFLPNRTRRRESLSEGSQDLPQRSRQPSCCS